jgi:uncharacterized protein involved in exopolysaccharide biosynthesis
LLAILSRRKRLIACSALIGGALAAIAALLMPDIYTATAVVMPPQKEQSAATALMGQLGPLAAAAGADMGLKSPSDLYVGLLGSRTIADRLIEQFQLRKLYRTKTLAATRAQLKRHSRISAGRDTLIKIEVEDTDPSRAATLANGYVAELNRLNKGLATTDAGQRRRFLEGQLGHERTALADAEDAMKKQQMQSGIIQPDAQTTVAIGSAAQLRAQVAAGEVAIERLKIGATPQNPELLRAQTELEAMRAQLRKLERGSQPGDALPSPSKIPESGLEYLRRLRELKYHELLVELLSKQYEAARLDESKAAPDLPIVDRAIPPDRRSGPQRQAIAFLGCLGGAALAVLIAYFKRSESLGDRT